MRILFVLSLVTISVFGLNGQQVFSHDTIDFSSMVIPLKIKETGRNVTIITREEISKISATSIDEILQTIAGIEIQSRGGFGVQSDILMRGSTFTQVLILIDGMKMNDPLTSHFNGNIPVSVAEIEKIEVLRGAASAIYGADAVGGVINIVTKAFSKRSNPNSQQGRIAFGSNKTSTTDWGFFHNSGKLSLSGGIAFDRSDGELIPEKKIDETVLEPYETYFDNKRMGVALAYELNDEYTFRFRTAYDHRDFAARYFYTSSPLDKSTEEVTNWWNSLQVSRINDKTSSEYNLAYKYTTDEFVFSPDFSSTNNHTTQYINFIYNRTQVVNEHVTIAAGLQFDRRSIESNDRGNHDDLHHGLYVVGNYNKGKINANLSLRGDYDQNFEFELTPGLNVSYALSQIVFRASAGRSIRAADFTERFVSNNLESLTPERNLGNPDLLAERAWSQELGLDYFPHNNLRLSLTGFMRQSKNLIDYVKTNQSEIGSVSSIGTLQEGADYFFAQNIASVNTTGAEVFIDYRVALSKNSKFHINGAYTHIYTSNDADIISRYISSHAGHLINTNLHLEIGRLSFNLNSIYKNRNVVDAPIIASTLSRDYIVVHGRANLQLVNQLALYMDIRNISNTEYANILGSPMPGRWVLVGCNWRM